MERAIGLPVAITAAAAIEYAAAFVDQPKLLQQDLILFLFFFWKANRCYKALAGKPLSFTVNCQYIVFIPICLNSISFYCQMWFST